MFVYCCLPVYYFFCFTQERVELVASGKHKPVNLSDEADSNPVNPSEDWIKKRKLSSEDSDEANRPKKRGKKKILLKKMKGAKTTTKMSQHNLDELAEVVALDQTVSRVPSLSESNSVRKTKDSSVQEISPFEHVPTFKCQFCSKRSQVPPFKLFFVG